MCVLLELTVSLNFMILRVLYAHSEAYSAFVFIAGEYSIIWLYQHLFIRHPPLMSVQMTCTLLGVVVLVHTFLRVYEQGFL